MFVKLIFASGHYRKKKIELMNMAIRLFAIICLMAGGLQAQDHSLWQQVLDRHVKQGKVDYAAIKSNPALLDQYINELRKGLPTNASREAAMAYWMNAYNAFTIKLIIDNYPLKSIRDLHNGNPWAVKWIKLGGKTYTLDDIEKGILLPEFEDGRIHFGINCAAISCPPLSGTAFTATNVDAQLDFLTQTFVQNNVFNSVSNNVAEVSSLFDWYKGDFGDVKSFLEKYGLKDFSKITFKHYDWNLNGK